MKKRKKTGLIFFPAFDWAISPTHPEREERLLYTQDQVFEEGLMDFDNIVEYKPGLATVEDINRVHVCVPDARRVITESHLISAGGAITAAKKVLEGEVDNAFALVRPPGHHAMRIVHGARGFCNINIEAIMIEYIRRHYGIKRIAIVDTDCHHGDGTQDIYWHDPNTLFISMHQDGRTLYPGSGFVDEFGGPNAVGMTVNIPLPPRTSDEGFLYALENVVLPILEEFKPELVINSAGQDNHYSDPITNMRFSAQGYAVLNDRLSPHIAVLEGGYSIEKALPYVNVGIILAMAGLDYSAVREPDYNPAALQQSEAITTHIHRTVDEIMRRWYHRREIAEAFRGKARYLKRRRHIYYDTDGISEEQEETVRVCDDCGGLILIDSRADTGRRIFAVIVPGMACERCRKEGEVFFEEIGKGKYHQVFFQDRDRDVYLVK
ncbi:MAG TPA: histone deacetylase [Syntrophales bacterium]|nr:histone deacetylase [Syntrophales bacterium]HOM07873.1 histone deacetylase [Syntrophales bacterium]HPQ07364.1 histone deacetylase [Syntrophales bacterium]HRS87528.1 histone deacetylase [Syntrophales bacterium]HRV42917.1 histone deacetylase [Syntrophales bacterium]